MVLPGLEEGSTKAGDIVALRDRPNPEWSLMRVQHFLYKDDAIKEFVDLQFLGTEIKGIFQKRLRKEIGNQALRLLGDTTVPVQEKWTDYKVKKRMTESNSIISFQLEALEQSVQPIPVVPGNHVRIRLGDSKLTTSLLGCVR